MASEQRVFEVTVTKTDLGYEVEVSEGGPGLDFAKIHSTADLWTALRMALPYMAAAAEPDPFPELLRGLRK